MPRNNGILVKINKINKRTGAVVQWKEKSRFNLGKNIKSVVRKEEKVSDNKEGKGRKFLAVVLDVIGFILYIFMYAVNNYYILKKKNKEYI